MDVQAMPAISGNKPPPQLCLPVILCASLPGPDPRRTVDQILVVDGGKTRGQGMARGQIPARGR